MTSPAATTSASSLSSLSVVQRRENILSAEVQGNLVLMAVDQGLYVSLDEVARAIWARLEAPVTVQELCTSLAQDYEGDAAVILGDVVESLEHLEKCSLLERVQEK